MTAPLDLDQLQSFCAIADCGSFTEAARRVNKTQSAVSMQIKRLEERLGHALLSRDGRSVTLTHHGEVLYERARKMLARGDDPQEVLDALSRGLAAKFLHGPQQALHRAQGDERARLAALLPQLFRGRR